MSPPSKIRKRLSLALFRAPSMAAAVFSVMLWSLATILQGGLSSPCGVTCTTDYNLLLNCSCASVPARALRLDVNCSDGELHAAGSCLLTPPQSWCVMYPPALYRIAAVGTECTARAGGPHDRSSSWALYDVVKAPTPFNVRVTSGDGSYNISWDLANDNRDCLTYGLRIRTGRGHLKDPARFFSADEPFFAAGREELPPGAQCSVAVRAKLCPGNPTQGPWSEWSSTVGWTNTPAESADVLVKRTWLYISLAVLLLLPLPLAGLLLARSGKEFLLKRFHVSTYVSRPHDFFKPLYLDYGGNFKEWVKPAFSERDLFGSGPRAGAATGRGKAASEGDEEEAPPTGRLLLIPAPLAQLGHVSIHTVVLCQEDERDAPGPARGGQPDPEAEEAEEPEADEAERGSDDGYPRLDLDTVDSGFGECASPSHSGSGEPAGHFLSEPFASRSNYVKQWMVCAQAQENSANTRR